MLSHILHVLRSVIHPSAMSQGRVRASSYQKQSVCPIVVKYLRRGVVIGSELPLEWNFSFRVQGAGCRVQVSVCRVRFQPFLSAFAVGRLGFGLCVFVE